LFAVGQQDAQKYGTNRVAGFIEDAGGLDKLEGLQVHPNHEVYDKVVKILEMYFAASEEESLQGLAPAAPASAAGHFQFGPGGGPGAPGGAGGAGGGPGAGPAATGAGAGAGQFSF
jgi:importin subunit alpha-1